MQRIWHPYWNWEEYKTGMWRRVRGMDRLALLDAAVAFTGNAELYGSFMRRVIVEWPTSCEHNLTEVSMNRLAWVGHAACCLATGAPEDITRQAWSLLTDAQRFAADAQADAAVKQWEANIEEQDQQLCLDLA